MMGVVGRGACFVFGRGVGKGGGGFEGTLEKERKRKRAWYVERKRKVCKKRRGIPALEVGCYQ